MFGLVFSFVIPGILMGLALSEVLRIKRKRARIAAARRARLERQRRFCVYNLQEDWPKQHVA